MPRVRRSLCSLNSFLALLLAGTIIAAFLVMVEETTLPPPVPKALVEEHVAYSTVTGYFLQDEESTDPTGFDFTTTNFGLIDRTYPADAELSTNSKLTQWQRFARQIATLNRESGGNVAYKLFYFGRHGEGYHNVAEAFYGHEAWDVCLPSPPPSSLLNPKPNLTCGKQCYWSLRDGNETSTWADALLTPTGEAQARRAHDFWESAIKRQKIPTPESYYASPLLRCLATANLTFSGLDLPKEHPFVPTIKEGFREVVGAHTCDRRSAKAVIREKYPDWRFEANFAEEDPLWSPTLRETDQAIDQRTAKVLQDVWTSDQNVYISVSAHSGEISSILRVLKHRRFPLGTGQAIPILIKAEKVPGAAPPPKEAPWEPVATCSQLPG
ncbi:GPI anchored protein [Diplocarpon mali]|nr:GPI anchored protein [Diplocarpon mali]